MILEPGEIEQYHQREVTIGVGWSNIIGVIVIIPVVGLFGVPYYFLWQDVLASTSFRALLGMTSVKGLATLAFFIVTGVIGHELIHGIIWLRYCVRGFKSISFGVMWKFITPYCHCDELLKVRHYRIGVIMPAIVLGFLPSIIGIATGSFGALAYGIFFSIAAGGDFLMMWILRSENADNYVLDHPTKVGCLIYEQIT